VAARRLASAATAVTAFPRDASFPARASTNVTGDAPPRRRDAPAETVVLPTGRHWIPVRSRRRETGQADETPWIDAWKPLPPDLHAIVERTDSVVIGRVAVDRLEVSEAQYARFCTETGYQPRVPDRHVPFLGARAALEDAPVTYVDLDDARAYARWCGARLPSPAEWQLAQAVGAERREPLVWNLTDSERTDGITRYVLLKGGSDFAAAGSSWYVDGGPQPPEWELKFVLPGGGLQRSSRIGFRCAYDLIDEGGTTI
jgi:formylglycine-generating enzyme required for sulfatase activity